MVVVPSVDRGVKEGLEGKSASEDGGHKDGVSLKQSRELYVSIADIYTLRILKISWLLTY